MSEYEFTDRYEALGIEAPSPEEVCEGQCEGTGTVPIAHDDLNDPWFRLWREAHEAAGEHECDGWHFVRCPDCDGSGKRRPEPQEEQTP